MSYGVDKVCFVCLWNGGGGDGPGGTKNMHDGVEKCAGGVFVLDMNIIFKEGTS